MSKSWPEMFNQYLRNYENMNEFFNDYIERMKAINELFVGMVQNNIKINEEYGKLIKTSENVYALHIAYIELLQKFNKQWLELLWGPALANFQYKINESRIIKGEKRK